MPCRPAKARHLLKAGKAKVLNRLPFTIQLLQATGETKQELILGLDPGSKTLGTAVRLIKTTKIFYASNVTFRSDIKKKLKQRSSYRRTRRSRKLRSRRCKFYGMCKTCKLKFTCGFRLNRIKFKINKGKCELEKKNKKNGFSFGRKPGWLPPSVQSKVDSTIKEINYILSILPVNHVIYEYSAFDIHKLKNPDVKGIEYQKGDMYGYENTKSYILSRDNYKCQSCKGKSKDKVLQVHHIIHRKHGGTDKPANLITLCSICHDKLHKGKLKLKTKKKLINTIDATQVSIINKRIRSYLFKIRKKYNLKVYRTYGYINKVKRKLLNLPKDHYLDGILCTYPKRDKYSNRSKPKILNFYKKVSVPKGDYKQTKGSHSQISMPTGKIHGFRKFDTVRYLGKNYFIRGRMSTGYANLMNIEQKVIKIRPMPKFEKIKKINAGKTIIVDSSPPFVSLRKGSSRQES